MGTDHTSVIHSRSRSSHSRSLGFGLATPWLFGDIERGCPARATGRNQYVLSHYERVSGYVEKTRFTRHFGVGFCVSTIHGFRVHARSVCSRHWPLSWSICGVRHLTAWESVHAYYNSMFLFSMYSTKYLIPSQYSTSSPATPCTTSASRCSSALGTLYTSIILVEPALIDRRTYDAHLDDREGQINAVMKSVVKSRATWNSREEALSWLTKKYPWKTWDRMAVKLFVVRYGSPSSCLSVRCTSATSTDNEPIGARLA